MQNTGFFTIKNIVLVCFVEKLEAKGGIKILRTTARPEKIEISILTPGEKSRINLHRTIKVSNIKQTTIIVNLKYEPIIPISFKKRQKFITARNHKNELIWIPMAESK